jgi:serine phosphatase RsbU (regulator of sigma subunit)/anti-sigma regulatory factor (Ser/Thr protein kinase)/PAS domain-containing protein
MKKQLKQRLQKEEEDLMCRTSEITTLYDTSNALGYTLNYQQIVTIVTQSLSNILNFDMCIIFLNEFNTNGELFSSINKPLHTELVKKVINNLLGTLSTFSNTDIPPDTVKIHTKKHYTTIHRPTKSETIKSFETIPLIFKEEFIGLLNVCSTESNAFPKSKLAFLHIMANQLTSNIGRLKIIKQLEESKLNSLIKSMTDSVMMLDKNHTIIVINPSASKLLTLKKSQPSHSITIKDTLKKLKLHTLYATVLTTQTTLLNQKVSLKSRDFSLNITPVINPNSDYIGTVFVFRDITQFQKMDRIKTQRLTVISKVNEIINSISDLTHLLDVLIKFILNIANAEMGSIQLKKGSQFLTIVHSNFPEKIQLTYTLKNGTTISNHVISTQKTIYIENYHQNELVNPNAKIFLESYLCIPIQVNKILIGIVNIARKKDTPSPKLSQDDLLTLKTITELSGTAIQNAQRYHETLQKQRTDQELLICNRIQKKLIPNQLPKVSTIEFGAMSQPAKEIGGDYYDFFKFNNEKIGIVVADIVGKGLPAGLFMAMLKTLLITHTNTRTSPEKTLNKLNDILCKHHIITKFIPLFYGILNTTDATLSYCNAGHEAPLWLSNNRFRSLNSQNVPLGTTKSSTYTTKLIQLKKDDILVLYTDGVIDARNKNNTPFGITRLKNNIKKHTKKTAEEITATLYSQLQKHSYQKQQTDDITIVTIKVKKTSSKEECPTPLFEKKIIISSAKSNIKIIRNKVVTLCRKLPFTSEDIYNIKLAINEAHANVIEHAYNNKPNQDIIFKFRFFQNRLSIHIIDFGVGFDQKTIKGEKHHLNDLEGSGLGLFLIKSLMDNIEHTRYDNKTELILTKNFIQPIDIIAFKGDRLWK